MVCFLAFVSKSTESGPFGVNDIPFADYDQDPHLNDVSIDDDDFISFVGFRTYDHSVFLL